MIVKRLSKFILLTLIVTSCGYVSAPRYIKKGFTYKFENKYTGIDTVININGYFVKKIPNRRTVYSIGWKTQVRYEDDTIYSRFLFYPNGIYVAGFHDFNNLKQDKSEDINRYFAEIVHDSVGKVKREFYTYSEWGSYKLYHDTIKVQFIYRPGILALNDSWEAYESWYKVIDRNTIIEINLIPIRKTTDSDKSNWELKTTKELSLFLLTQFQKQIVGYLIRNGTGMKIIGKNNPAKRSL